MAEYIIPTDARAEYRKIIQRANRRILSNLKYIKEEGIRSKSIKTSLAGDYTSKKKWASAKSPLSYSTRFKSEQDYQQFMRYVDKWGKKEEWSANPNTRRDRGKQSIYKAIYGLSAEKGISLEKWKGGLPPDMIEKIEDLTLEQMSKFFDYVGESGEELEYDSDQVAEENVEDFLDYIGGRLSEVVKFYPKKSKKLTKKKKKRKSRRKTKGRKKK